MIGGSDNYRPTREIVHLKQQRAYDTLNLTSLVDISPLFSNDVELIEKKYTRGRSRKIENFTKSACGFAEEAANYRLVPDGEKWNTKGFGQSLGHRCFAVTGRSCQ